MSRLQQLWWHWLCFVARCQCQRWPWFAQCQIMVFDKKCYGDWKTQVLTSGAQKSDEYKIWTFWISSLTSSIHSPPLLSVMNTCHRHDWPPSQKYHDHSKICWPWSGYIFITIWYWHIFQLLFLFVVNIFLQHLWVKSVWTSSKWATCFVGSLNGLRMLT